MNDHSAALAAKRQALLEAGVEMLDPASVYVEDSVTVGEGTLLLPGTILRGNTTVGANCQIGPNVMLTDCAVGEGTTINSSQCEESEIGPRCEIGPTSGPTAWWGRAPRSAPSSRSKTPTWARGPRWPT